VPVQNLSLIQLALPHLHAVIIFAVPVQVAKSAQALPSQFFPLIHSAGYAPH